MPALLLLFGASIKYLMAFAVVRFLLAMGLSYVSYQGMDVLTQNIRTELETQFSSLGAALDMMSLFGVDVAMSIMLSAITIRLTLLGFSGGIKHGLRFGGITGA